MKILSALKPRSAPSFPKPPGPPPEVAVGWVWVTPEWCRAMLEWTKQFEFVNRPVYSPWVNALIGDMVFNRWEITHQGIALDPNWALIDGRHRLLAIIKSGKSQWMLVSIFPTQAMAQNAVKTMDRQRRRQVGQTVSMLGTADGPHRSAVASAILHIVRNSTARISDGLVHQTIADTLQPFSEVQALLKNERIRRLTAPPMAALVCAHALHPGTVETAIKGTTTLASGCQQMLVKLLTTPPKVPKDISKEELFVRILWLVEILNTGRIEAPRALQNRTRSRILGDARTTLLNIWPDMGEEA